MTTPPAPIRLLALLFVLHLASCGRAPEPVGPTRFMGTVRYQEDGKLLEATVSVGMADTTMAYAPPTLLGSVMDPLPRAGANHYRSRRTLPFPVPLRFGVPRPGSDNATLEYRFMPPLVDSLPRFLEKTESLRVPVGSQPLADNESLVVFFEPVDRSTPRRLQLVGPTKSNYLSVRPAALADIPPGDYMVYLVKQQLHKVADEEVRGSLQTEYFTRSKAVKVRE